MRMLMRDPEAELFNEAARTLEDYDRRGLIPGKSEACIRGICYHPECMMSREMQSGSSNGI